MVFIFIKIFIFIQNLGEFVYEVLSKELSLYYIKITHAILYIDNKTNKSPQKLIGESINILNSSSKVDPLKIPSKNEIEFKNECLKCVSNDPGLQRLTPYFIEFLTKSVVSYL